MELTPLLFLPSNFQGLWIYSKNQSLPIQNLMYRILASPLPRERQYGTWQINTCLSSPKGAIKYGPEWKKEKNGEENNTAHGVTWLRAAQFVSCHVIQTKGICLHKKSSSAHTWWSTFLFFILRLYRMENKVDKFALRPLIGTRGKMPSTSLLDGFNCSPLSLFTHLQNGPA